MSNVLIVARKELRELLRTRSTVLTGAAMSLFFGGLYSIRVGQGSIPIEASLGSMLFFLTTTIGVFMGYMLTGHVFLREKMDGVVETLLCSPVTLRDVWLGKVVAVTALADLFALASSALTVTVTGLINDTFAVPPAAIVVHVLIVIPMVIGCFVGVLGFAQLLLGMRENRIIGMVLFIPIFGALYGLGYTATGSFVASWLHVAILGGAAAAVLAVVSLASRRLNKERIVTTLS